MRMSFAQSNCVSGRLARERQEPIELVAEEDAVMAAAYLAGRQRSELCGRMTRSRIVIFLGRVIMNSTAAATSFGSITSPAVNAASSFSFGQSLSRAVTTGPGAIAPTRIPYLATCRRTVWTNACTACLEAV